MILKELVFFEDLVILKELVFFEDLVILKELVIFEDLVILNELVIFFLSVFFEEFVFFFLSVILEELKGHDYHMLWLATVNDVPTRRTEDYQRWLPPHVRDTRKSPTSFLFH